MSLPLFLIGAFSTAPFGGNPAAICLLERGHEPADEWMQDLAKEMNLSETAFVVQRDSGFGLRWYTPAYEVKLCGHATLASAHCLWNHSDWVSGDEIVFHTLSGELIIRREGALIEMDFPAVPESEAPEPAGLCESLGVEPLYVGSNGMDFLVEVATRDQLRNMKPDFGKLSAVETRGVIVTCRGDDQHDFYSRFFAPNAGINEDPVTGSAHCCLTPYWSKKLGKTSMVGFQGGDRTGVVRVRDAGERVFLAGQAKTVVEGKVVAVPRSRKL
ncbi:MAG: PhzF family phenazine biosynthesis protein [Pirellulaceae bacterium]|jgi:PhzF family phenazine biosynthesis protein